MVSLFSGRYGLAPIALIFIFLGLIVSPGSQSKATVRAPQITRGLVDLTGWDFRRNGPFVMEGDWEVRPEGKSTAATDYIQFPWGDRPPLSSQGKDYSQSQWLDLNIRVQLPPSESGVVLEMHHELAEAVNLRCVSDLGSISEFKGGFESGVKPVQFFEALWPRGSVALSSSGVCSIQIPRGSKGAVQSLVAPTLVLAADAGRSFSVQISTQVFQLGFVIAFVIFALIMMLLNRRDGVARWAFIFSILYLIRLIVSNRGLFFEVEDLIRLQPFLGYRLEFAGLWLFGFAFARYGEELTGRQIPGRSVIYLLFFIWAGVGILFSYSLNIKLILGGQLALLYVFSATAYGLFLLRRERASLLALVGIGTTLLGATGSILWTHLFSTQSLFFEFIASTEPLFQMAVLALRASDARKKAVRLAESTSRFVPQEFLKFLGHQDVTTAQLGDATTREMTILFSDIRNFTSLSERLSAAQVFSLLNDCLSRIGPHIRRHGGFIDKYIGDAIMALFPENPSDSVRAALEMQKELRPPLSMGIGIHYGSVIMGTIGEEKRFEATVISDSVNLSARLESLTKQLHCTVLISADVFQRLESSLKKYTRYLGLFTVKGKSKPVGIYEVFSNDSESLREFKSKNSDEIMDALQLYRDGELEKALTVFWNLSQLCPEDGPALWWLGRIEREASGDLPRSQDGSVLLDEK